MSRSSRSSTASTRCSRAKATPSEGASFRAWILQSAQDVAAAAREDGFLGIGAMRISEGEAAMLDRLRQILGVEPA